MPRVCSKVRVVVRLQGAFSDTESTFVVMLVCPRIDPRTSLIGTSCERLAYLCSQV